MYFETWFIFSSGMKKSSFNVFSPFFDVFTVKILSQIKFSGCLLSVSDKTQIFKWKNRICSRKILYVLISCFH